MTSQYLRNHLIMAFSLIIYMQHVNGQQPVCGPALDMMLDSICENGFNMKFKKSIEWHDNTENADKLPFQFGSFPFLAKIHGGQIDTLAKTRRRREGVYDECCRKPCTYNELLSYCN
ncbi:probable insulin-like peptide 5 [Eurosta solidaginis]|uniref:probable insulin-like peptide 5 n=1 Tax=Eurosta solidaginis TaxID=178769 RepID=UPI003530D193